MVWRYTLIFDSEVPLIVLMKFTLFGVIHVHRILHFLFACFDDDIGDFQKNLSNKPKDFSMGLYNLILTLFWIKT